MQEATDELVLVAQALAAASSDEAVLGDDRFEVRLHVATLRLRRVAGGDAEPDRREGKEGRPLDPAADQREIAPDPVVDDGDCRQHFVGRQDE